MTKPTPKKHSNGRIRSWLHGAFCMAALVSFSVNYCVFSGKLKMDLKPVAIAEQAPRATQGQREQQISMADLQPTPTEAAKWGRR